MAKMADTSEGQDKGDLKNDVTAIDGINFGWVTPPSTLEALKTFEVRQDDVFIVTFPKSGTHWILEIVYLVLANGEMDKINRVMMEQGLEFTRCTSPLELSKTKPGYQHMQEWASPRVMNTHLMHRFLPPQIWEKNAKVIYMMRNPKDVVCSMYSFMYALMPEGQRDWNKFVQFFTSEASHVGGWKAKFNEEQNKLFADNLDAIFKDTGLTIDFELKTN